MAMVLGVLALTLAAPAQARKPRYAGVMTLGGGPVRTGSQGGYWQSRFTVSEPRRITYSACVVHLTRKDTVSCKPGHTGARGISRLFFAGFVNAHPGRWAVRFFIHGHQVASWRFRVRSEGV